MDEILFDQLLFDYYGSLLTPKQQQILKFYYEENLTLSEIAENSKTSRQAVHDIIRRAHRSLETYEDKLGLIALDTRRDEILSEAINNLKKIDKERVDTSRIDKTIVLLEKLKDGQEQ